MNLRKTDTKIHLCKKNFFPNRLGCSATLVTRKGENSSASNLENIAVSLNILSITFVCPLARLHAWMRKTISRSTITHYVLSHRIYICIMVRPRHITYLPYLLMKVNWINCSQPIPTSSGRALRLLKICSSIFHLNAEIDPICIWLQSIDLDFGPVAAIYSIYFKLSIVDVLYGQISNHRFACRQKFARFVMIKILFGSWCWWCC